MTIMTRYIQCPKIAILLGCQSEKFKAQKDGESGKFAVKKRAFNSINVENRGYFGLGGDLGGDGDATLVAYIKTQLGSGKLTQNMRNESGKLSTTRCHLPP